MRSPSPTDPLLFRDTLLLDGEERATPPSSSRTESRDARRHSTVVPSRGEAPAVHEDETVTFEPPAGWTNKTIVAYVAPPGSGRSGENLVLTRERVPSGTSLEAYVDEQLALLQGARGFALLDQKNCLISGRSAIIQRITRRTDRGSIDQAMAYVLVEAEHGGSPTCVTFTASVPYGNGNPVAILDETLPSVRLRGRPPSLLPSIPPAPATPRSTVTPWEMKFIPMPGERDDGRGR